jgi:WD40 repeat protein
VGFFSTRCRRHCPQRKIIDPFISLHLDTVKNRMLFLTGNVYGIYENNTVNKISFVQHGDFFDDFGNALKFVNQDRYAITTGYKEMLIDNENLSILKEFQYSYGIVAEQSQLNLRKYTTAFKRIGKDTGLITVFHPDDSARTSQLAFNELIELAATRTQFPVNKALVKSFNFSTKQILNTNAWHSLWDENPESPTNFFISSATISTASNNYSIPILHNTPGGTFNWDAARDRYLYLLENKLYSISKSDLLVKGKAVVLTMDSAIISNNGKYVLGMKNSLRKGFTGREIHCYDPNNKFIFKTPVYFNGDKIDVLVEAVFSRDNKTVCILSSPNNTIRVVNAVTGTPMYNLTGHSDRVLGVEYSSDSKFIYSWSADGSCKKWEAQKGKLIYTMLFFEDGDYAFVLPDGYYFISSRTDARYLNFKLNGRRYNFSQFDVQFNRPDLVLKAIGSKDKILIDDYYNAWVSRIKKAGFKEADFNSKVLHVPEVSLITDNIPAITTKRELLLPISLSDSLFNIKSYNIFVNDVPLKGINEKFLSKPDHHLELSEQVLLSEGENRIEVNCTNEKGASSRKEIFYIQYQGETKAKHKTYFIGIGINQYSAHSSFLDLGYCVKDIRDLSEAFKDKFKEKLVIDTLMNDNASKENILALKQNLMQTDVDDRVIVSFSGHGMVDPLHPGDFYFVTGTTDVNSPAAGGISYSQLEELLDSIPARKKLLLLDACHSGESDGGAGTVSTHIPGTKRGDDNKNKAGSIEILDVVENSDRAHASSTDVFKLMKEAFVDIRRNNGAYVLSAAQSNESAGEGGGISNGWFSSCLIEQLKQNSSMSVNDLSRKVSQCVNVKSGGNQNTDNRQELAECNWVLW